MSNGVVIPAAGQGKRMNSKVNKLYIELMGRPVLAHTLSVFISNNSIDQIIVVTAADEIDYCRENIINKYFKKNVELVAGGKTRRESVFAGLQAFSPAIDYVIIHDGARPLITQSLLNRVIETLNSYNAVVVGTRLKDTVKRVDSEDFVVETPQRSTLMTVQTPQAFLYKDILEAHKKVPEDYPATDDASLLEYMGKPVKVIEGSYENIKITVPLDIITAENILKQRRKCFEDRDRL
ncbi:MAG: 2-C-methyl-D-erythritol 4-phosphate cytidylyltransferase [Halanaerobiaceae bacterium]|nr:2-C-methyl-D-erythritol 4-phosphate cytidylyltransferase [Halanaerobiaceae bacterium]